MKYKVFISSVQREFSKERRELCNYIRTDYLLARFFQPIIFEETPATEDSAQKVYLKEAGESDIYLGLFGNLYGYEDEEGISPTEREFDEATRNHRCRLIFIRSFAEEQRHPKQRKLIEKVERQIVRRTFVDMDDLFHCVYASLVRFLEEHEFIRILPFDASKDTGAGMEELDEDKIRDFIRVAVEHRKLALPSDISSADLLRHFDLMDEQGHIANAAILLFGKKPQKYFLPSEVKCVQFYGTVVEKPMPALHVYKGDVFELVEQAVDFVMSRIDIWTGLPDSYKTAQAETKMELPWKAVREAIVNAVCHRDYTSNGSVQVMLFKDRLEI